METYYAVVDPIFRQLIQGKEIASGTVKLHAMVAGRIENLPPITLEEYFTNFNPEWVCHGRRADSVTFTDGSRFCWQGNNQRYMPMSQSEIKECEGNNRLENKNGFFFLKPDN